MFYLHACLSAQNMQKRVLNSLELELEIVVSELTGIKRWNLNLHKNIKASIFWAIFLAC